MTDAEAELLAAVQRDPADEETRLVYADWLEERGDPRGEYLRLELQFERIPQRLAELVNAVDPAWLRATSRTYAVALLGATSTKIAAIKVVREITGLGLREAKDIVDDACAGKRRVVVADLDRDEAQRIAKLFDGVAPYQIEIGSGHRTVALPPVPTPPSFPTRQRNPYRCILTGLDPTRRAEAIQLVRSLTSRGLREAVALVDAVLAGTPSPLAFEVEPRAAVELAVAFGELGQVKIVLNAVA